MIETLLPSKVIMVLATEKEELKGEGGGKPSAPFYPVLPFPSDLEEEFFSATLRKFISLLPGGSGGRDMGRNMRVGRGTGRVQRSGNREGGGIKKPSIHVY